MERKTKRFGQLNGRVCMGIAILLLLPILSFSVAKNQMPDTKILVQKGIAMVYLYNPAKDEQEPIIVSEEELVGQDQESIIRYLLTVLKTGKPQDSLSPVIPDNVRIDRFHQEKDKLTLFFSPDYYMMSNISEIMMRSSLVKSLTSVEGIRSVQILVGGVPLGYEGGNKRLYPDDVYINYQAVNQNRLKRQLKLYLPTAQNKLRTEHVEIEQQPIKKVEEYVMECLIATDKVLSKQVRLLNIYTHQGICFIDLSSEFLKADLPNNVWPQVAVYAIVNSITELPGVNGVQILIEGKIESSFHGNKVISQVIRKNNDLME